MTRWRVDETNFHKLPSIIQTQYRLAICSQIDFLALNGVESISGGDDVGFTVGKVRVEQSISRTLRDFFVTFRIFIIQRLSVY